MESEWGSARVAAAVAFVVDRVRQDVGTVTDLESAAVVSARHDPAWAGDGAEGAEAVVGVVFDGRHEFPLGLEDGVEHACRNLADQTQDDLVGELGRPWPQLLGPDGAARGVLQPALHGGIAVWELRGRPFCAIGHLVGAVTAAGVAVG